jgi:Zn-dependent metalloprotease
MKNYTKLLTLVLFFFIVFISNAQQNDTLEIQRNDKGIVSFARFKTDPDRKIQNGINFLKEVLHAKSADEFRLVKETKDELGISHLRFQQYYKGIKVEDSEFLIHGKDGIIETINGDFKHVNIPSVTPAINDKQALGKALDYVNAQKYKWEDEGYEKFIKQRKNNPEATYYPSGELVITKDYLNGGKKLRLSWKFSISSLIPNNEQLLYIDAMTGEVVRDIPMIFETNVLGSAETIFSGTLAITCDSYASGYRLNETRTTTPGHSVNIHTWNCLSEPNYTNAVEFSNNNTNWTTGSWPAITQDQAALDAHWGEEMVLDYWRTVHSRNSLNDQGISVIGYVHYYDPLYPDTWPNNAQWDGNNHVMRYGDGDGIIFHPLTALDVVAHEMGHGITQFTANLTYGTQESGALNEGFSDIWATCVEHWAAPNKQTWLMGEEIFNTPLYTCIRDLQNPNSTTAAEGQHPDTYQGDFWDYNGEPHNNSTVLSHWFYLLSEGGNGTNDNGDCFNVAAIGINNAERIAYRTELTLNSSATYADARNMSIQAATDLFGSNSNQLVQTTNAWYAVGVGDEYQYTVSGPSIVCSSGSTFSVTNLPFVDSIIWSTGRFLMVYSGQNTNAPVIGATGSGSSWVTARLVTDCRSITLPQQEVWAGAPKIANIDGPTTTPNNQWAYYTAQLESTLSSPTDYNWILNPLNGNSVYDYGQYCDIAFYNSGSYQLVVQAKNTCSDPNYGPYYVTGIYVYDTRSLSFSPNPTTGETTLTIETNSAEKTFDESAEWNLEVYSETQLLKTKQTSLRGRSAKIQTAGWKEGVYMVRVNYNGEVLTGKLVVKIHARNAEHRNGLGSLPGAVRKRTQCAGPDPQEPADRRYFGCRPAT